ncbi:MAG: hypothetical protein ABSE51_18825 [Terracidiphilus sp.]|jgi:hypothetical protein
MARLGVQSVPVPLRNSETLSIRPPPFCYMKTGFAPYMIRRRIPVRRIGKQINPFRFYSYLTTGW